MSVISHHTSDDRHNGRNDASKNTLAGTFESQRKSRASRASKGQCIFLVVDRPMTREGLALVLEQANFRIVGQAGNGKETLAHPGLALTEVVVVDLLSGEEEVVSLIKALSSRHLRSVVCSIRENSTRISTALAAGAGGYVTANDEPQHLVEAIRAVVAGCNYVSPRAGAAEFTGSTSGGAPVDFTTFASPDTFTLQVIPEPGSCALLGAGGWALMSVRRHRSCPRFCART